MGDVKQGWKPPENHEKSNEFQRTFYLIAGSLQALGYLPRPYSGANTVIPCSIGKNNPAYHS